MNDNKLNQVVNQTSLHYQSNPTAGFSPSGVNNQQSFTDYKFPGEDYLSELEQRMYNYNKPF